jgi:hypothetical protein
MWFALQIGKSLDHFTNYQVMNEVSLPVVPLCVMLPRATQRKCRKLEEQSLPPRHCHDFGWA